MVSHDFTYPLGHILTGVFWHRVEDGGLHFTISDTGWLKSLWGKMYGQWFGESAVFTYDFEKFNGADILSKLDRYKVTTLCVPPTMYRMILQEDVEQYDLSSLKHCCTAGEALSPEVYNQWKRLRGLKYSRDSGKPKRPCAVLRYTPGCSQDRAPWACRRPGMISEYSMMKEMRRSPV
jgi:acetyl-CoA synthetase